MDLARISLLTSFLLLSTYAAAQEPADRPSKVSLGIKLSPGITEIVEADQGQKDSSLLYALDLSYKIPLLLSDHAILGLELGQGRYEATETQSFTTLSHPAAYPSYQEFQFKYVFDLKYSAVVKFGYGLRLGDESMALLQFRTGLIQADATIDSEGRTLEESIQGRTMGVGFEAQTPLVSNVDLTFGFDFERIGFEKKAAFGSSDFRMQNTSFSVGSRYTL